ncbi:MAG TPA: hypothetical protein VMC79_03055 [Rectinemataceae bacterium]|nr:hypothetical protein [Rectinemataceae bacterium]
MNLLAQLLLVIACCVAGFFILWFLLRARIRRFLELENLLEGVRAEARSLVIELNESADRSVSLVEDRMTALHSLLDEVDRRMGVAKRELERRSTEREVYAKLAQRRPIVPSESGSRAPVASPGSAAADAGMPESSVPSVSAGAAPQVERSEPAAPAEEPIVFPLRGSGGDAPGRGTAPDVRRAPDPIVVRPSLREQAVALYRSGFSADLIAARVGMTVAEIELLVELEERRPGGES